MSTLNQLLEDARYHERLRLSAMLERAAAQTKISKITGLDQYDQGHKAGVLWAAKRVLQPRRRK